MTGPQDWVTTIGLVAATVAGAVGCAAAARRLARGERGRWLERAATVALTLLATGVFLYRMFALHGGRVPVESHADGLLLMLAMLGGVLVYLQWTGRLAGVSLFVLGAATVLALWGFCASWWTDRPFDMRGVWKQVHLFSVYSGTMGVTLAAAAGAMWLYVDRQLRSKDHRAERLNKLGKLASLEALESAVVHAATLGFVLVTVALVTGVVMATAEATKLGTGWWYSPKVVLAAAAWGIFALVMNVRHVATFRGRRAAVLSIVGFVLMMAVLGMAQALGTKGPGDQGTEAKTRVVLVPWSPGPSVPSPRRDA